jgi:hypothetical protein
MSSSDVSQGENLDDFQALFASLPKSTQQQLLTQVVAQVSIPNKTASPSIHSPRQKSQSVKVESVGNRGPKVLSPTFRQFINLNF